MGKLLQVFIAALQGSSTLGHHGRQRFGECFLVVNVGAGAHPAHHSVVFGPGRYPLYFMPQVGAFAIAQPGITVIKGAFFQAFPSRPAAGPAVPPGAPF